MFYSLFWSYPDWWWVKRIGVCVSGFRLIINLNCDPIDKFSLWVFKTDVWWSSCVYILSFCIWCSTLVEGRKIFGIGAYWSFWDHFFTNGQFWIVVFGKSKILLIFIIHTLFMYIYGHFWKSFLFYLRFCCVHICLFL